MVNFEFHIYFCSSLSWSSAGLLLNEWMSNGSQVHINLIISFVFVISVNINYTNLILSTSLWGWCLYLSVTMKTPSDNLFIALLLSFNTLNWRMMYYYQLLIFTASASLHVHPVTTVQYRCINTPSFQWNP